MPPTEAYGSCAAATSILVPVPNVVCALVMVVAVIVVVVVKAKKGLHLVK